MNLLRQHVLLLLCLSVSTFGVSIHVTENTPRRLSFTWEIGHVDTSSLLHNGQRVTIVGFDGENCKVNLNNLETVPGYTFHVGAPPEGDVKVRFSVEEFTKEKLYHPLISDSATDTVPTKLSFSDRWISDPVYSKFRRYRVAQMTIRPFMYNRTDKSLRVARKGTCTIIFPKATHSGISVPYNSHYHKMLQTLLINYDIASGWGAAKKPLRKRVVSPHPIVSDNAQKVFTFTIGDGYRSGNECTIEENGILRISGTEIVERFGNVAIQSVVLYGSPKEEMSLEIPAPDAIPTALTEIPLIRFDANGNNVVDNGDYFLAYVSGTSDWKRTGGDFTFNLNRYTDYRNYWLTITTSGNGMEIPRFIQPDSARMVYDQFENRLYLKESRINPKKEGGLNWIWTKLTRNNTVFEYTLPITTTHWEGPGLIRIVGSTYGMVNVTSNLSNGALSSNDWYTLSNAGGEKRLRITAGGFCVIKNEDDDKRCLDDYYGFEHIEIKHMQKIRLVDNSKPLFIFSKMDPGIVSYRLSDIGNRRVYIFRIPLDEQKITLIGVVSGQNEYTWSDTSGLGVRYLVCTETAFQSLPAVEQIEKPKNDGNLIRKLRSTGVKTNYLIVTHQDFIDGSRKLAKHKSDMGCTNPSIVLIDDIYNQFSGGNPDPAALRNFLSYAYYHWGGGEVIDYVTLMGNGHYDYKGLASIEPVYLPTAQINDQCLEDFFSYLDPDSGTKRQTLFIGRIPVKSNAEAENVVEKIVEHERPDVADYGVWRNRALFVADDDMQGKDIDNNGTAHLSSSELVSSELSTMRPSMDIRKVYLFEYGWNEIYEKPEASRAIINEINNGVAIVNYFGHGAYHLWADEHVLSPDKVATFHNSKRYPIISSFSCSVGHFDKPDDECLSGLLVKRKGGGAIATISSTRESYAYSNESLAKALYTALFDSSTGSSSLGSALMVAKTKGVGSSERIYAILGDPSISLTHPKRTITLKIDTANGAFTDTVKALQRVSIVGSIIDDNGSIDKNFGSKSGAYVHLGFFNAPDTTSRKDGRPVESVSYILPGNPIFSGNTQVHDGVFEQDVLLPRNISFDKEGVKLIAYAWEGSTTGTGYKAGIYFHGTDTSTTNITDTTGPRITVRPVYDNEDGSEIAHIGFSDRITSLLPFKCEIELFDESGIDVINTGPDEGLSIEVDNVLKRQNINHKFQFKEGDFRRGAATMSFEEGMMRTGSYKVTVSGQDLLGNVSKMTFVLDIVAQDDLKLDHVFNYPNPMNIGRATKFYFFHSNTAQQWNRIDIRVTLKIYTLSGRLLRVIEDAKNGEEWNGRDQVGNILGPNVYLYQVTAEAPLIQRVTKSKIKKIVIHPPR